MPTSCCSQLGLDLVQQQRDSSLQPPDNLQTRYPWLGLRVLYMLDTLVFPLKPLMMVLGCLSPLLLSSASFSFFAYCHFHFLPWFHFLPRSPPLKILDYMLGHCHLPLPHQPFPSFLVPLSALAIS